MITTRRQSRSTSRSEEHTSELQSREKLVCRLLLEKKKNTARVMRSRRRNPTTSSSLRRRMRVSTAHDPIRRASGWTGHHTSARGYLFFFFNDTATTEIYTLSLHDALPI